MTYKAKSKHTYYVFSKGFRNFTYKKLYYKIEKNFTSINLTFGLFFKLFQKDTIVISIAYTSSMSKIDFRKC